MFENSRDVTIYDGSFTVNVRTARRMFEIDDIGEAINILKILTEDGVVEFLKTASLNAILNAGGRADEVRCYPGTREEVIEKVERWRDGKGKSHHRMLWLSGHAGAGKSAIAQTVAERGREHGIHAANFFFFRGDHTRNHARSLVATLIYQLVKFYPALRGYLADCLTAQPLLNEASVMEQFAELLAAPIKNIHHSTDRQITLIIDGLDECNDDECDNESAQLEVLGALYTLASRDGSPFRVFVASRAEPHLVMFFNKFARSVESIFLSDEYRPEEDIRRFVAAKFDEIKGTHHLAHTLGKNWPTPEDIDKITAKSSGQFMFAATVMRFIEYSRDSPLLSLLTVHQLRPPANHSPFAQVDALYSHIFSKARDIRAIKWALAFHSMGNICAYIGRTILLTVGYERIDLDSVFSDISSIAQISVRQTMIHETIHVQFYHASLPDYLGNKSRSGVYHLDKEEIFVDVSRICLQKIDYTDTFDSVALVMGFIDKPTPELSRSLLEASKLKLGQGFARPDQWSRFIFAITRLYFLTDKRLCTLILQSWIRFAYMHNFDPTLWVQVEEDVAQLDESPYTYYEFLRVTETAKVQLEGGFNM